MFAVLVITAGSKEELSRRISGYPPPPVQPPPADIHADLDADDQLTELMKMSMKELHSLADTLRLSKCKMIDHLMEIFDSLIGLVDRMIDFQIAGKKDEIATRIVKKRKNTSTIQQNQHAIDSCLSPKLKTDPDKRPIVNNAYAMNFNLVDRFNRGLSSISYLPKLSSETMRLLVGVIEIAIV